MTTFLYGVGRFAFRRRRLVALVWVALLVAIGFAAAAAGSPANSPLNIPGTQSQRAFDLIAQHFPGTKADGANARVVFQAQAGRKVDSAESKAAIKKAVDTLKSSSTQVASVVDPFQAGAVSEDRTIAYIQVSYGTSASELTDKTVDALKHIGDKDMPAGLRVEVGGNALGQAPSVGGGEVVGLAITLIVLVLTFGSMVAAGLPLITALIGVAIGIAGITALSHALNLSSSTSMLALMLGLAVGIDYALFIVSRYRGELAGGHAQEEAAGRALGTAGSSVVFAGLTVVIALVGLAVVNIPNLTKMGLAAAGTVVIAVLIALTLVPALVGFAGRKVLPRKVRKGRIELRDATGPKLGARWARELVARWARELVARPALAVVVGVLGLAAVAVPALSLRMALPDDGHLPPETTQRQAYDLLTEGFGAGFNGPLTVVVDATRSADPHAAADRIGSEIATAHAVAAVRPAVFNKAQDTALLTVVPKTGPNAQETHDLVSSLRDDAGRLRGETNAQVLVTGTTALNIDISQRLSDALLPYLALVVGLAFVILVIVFRSILVPLKAALGFLLSVLAALGAIVAVFQWGWLGSVTGVDQTGPIMSTMPIFLIGIVFGLAMDYEVFLVSRMREAYAHGTAPRDAVITGFGQSSRVVTAGALIMISVFAGFMGSTEAMIKEIGFGLGVAVLFDAFVVRMLIVPAVLALLDRAAWWLPGWLDRILPNVDIEGAALSHPAAARTAADQRFAEL
ncbi:MULTISPECIES: MMPL family transporter [unclassified Streptomyces]|uniref:MMPL family transporter n=1 Tax=unclassified Streptomyces TaxID=2593676 RepID=UPI003369C3AD